MLVQFNEINEVFREWVGGSGGGLGVGVDRTLLITMTKQVVGAEIRTFLLERSRVTSTSKPLERAYHIMYQVHLTLALTLALTLIP